MTEPVHWGTDVPVSLPQPLPDASIFSIPMDGFCFTENGLFFDLSQADFDRVAAPSFAPELPDLEVVRLDEGL